MESIINKYVALYLRVSTEEQVKHGTSLDAQLNKLQEYCKFKEWTVFKIYKDEGISGGSTKKRKAFLRMIEDSKQGKFSAVVVTKIDRAFRNVVDALLVLEDFRVNDIDFVSIAEDIDTTTPMGKAMFTIISVFAQLEREMNAGRVRDVRILRFKQGMFPARAFFGYKPIKKDRKIIGFGIDKKKAEIVEDCFLMASNGTSYKKVCAKHKIKPQSYYNILENKVYYGIIEFEGEEKVGVHPAIISKELFEKVNQR